MLWFASSCNILYTEIYPRYRGCKYHRREEYLSSCVSICVQEITLWLGERSKLRHGWGGGTSADQDHFSQACLSICQAWQCHYFTALWWVLLLLLLILLARSSHPFLLLHLFARLTFWMMSQVTAWTVSKCGFKSSFAWLLYEVWSSHSWTHLIVCVIIPSLIQSVSQCTV